MNVQQLQTLIVKPVLEYLDMYSLAAEQLVLGTACQESHLEYLKQLGTGPALGIYQMEPRTHQDIFDNFLKYKQDTRDKVLTLKVAALSPEENLVGNLWYSTAMCRIHYRRCKQPLPEAGDIPALARYWKKWYNTSLGKGTEKEFIKNFERCGSLYR